tara:strand:- start:5445 stop:6668 length:1224 start_codon:yes stop_codon:yes gene_type:complete
MKIVDSNKQLRKHISQLQREKILVYPILTSLEKHSIHTRVSALIISDGTLDLFINYNNIDATKIDQKVEFHNFKEVYIVGMKDFLYHYDFLPNMYDLEMSLFWQAKNFDVEEKPIYTIFRRRQAPKANDLIPIWKHYEQFEDWKKLFVDSKISKFSQLYPKSLGWVEKNGLYTNMGYEYTRYNPLTITSRPSNTFKGTNYAALKKDDGVRSRFISRFENGKLCQLDFDGYHIRLISKLIGIDIPLDKKAHEWLANQYGKDISQAKAITFRQLYGGVEDEYYHIPFFKKTSDYINSLWLDFLRNREVVTPILQRKIRFDENLNKNKLFNYVLQALETERNILILDKLSKIDLNQKSIPVLYTYDSILFDVDEGEDKYIREVKKIMEKDGFPTQLEIGKDYDNMVKTNI